MADSASGLLFQVCYINYWIISPFALLPPVYICSPAYRNIEVAAPCIDSYLAQDYPNLFIRIYDNSASEGYLEIKKLISSKDDPRITYIPNLTNVGALANYSKIFSDLPTQGYCIVLSADMSMTPTAVSKLVDYSIKNNASIVYPRTTNFDWDSLENTGFSTFTKPLGDVPSPHERSELLLSRDLLSYYFSSHNLKGEYFGFSWAGALIDLSLLPSIPISTAFSIGPKGTEQFLSMLFLSVSESVYMVNDFLLHNFYGQPRLGGTQRTYGHLGRFNSLLACNYFLFSQKFFVLRKQLPLSKWHLSLANRCFFYLRHYSPARLFVFLLLLQNLLLSFCFQGSKFISR